MNPLIIADYETSHNRAKLVYYRQIRGLDGLAQDWTGETVWLVPPLNLLPAALNHMERCRARGLLVYPGMDSHLINPLVNQAKSRGGVRGQWEFPGDGVFVAGKSDSTFGPHYKKTVIVVKLDFVNI